MGRSRTFRIGRRVGEALFGACSVVFLYSRTGSAILFRRGGCIAGKLGDGFWLFDGVYERSATSGGLVE